jgi:formylglycine-generating enzyme
MGICLPGRAGTETPFAFGNDIDPGQANYDGHYPYRRNNQGLCRKVTVSVGFLPANPWGLYEMHGNVREWCQDWYGDYPEGPVTDPVGPAAGKARVLRGGGWLSYARGLRSACRSRHDPDRRNPYIGFRLALGPELRQ